MPSRSEMQIPAPRAVLAVLLALVAGGVWGVATADSASGSGSVDIGLSASAPAAKGLRAAGVRVSAGRPATASSKRWTLPVAGATSVTADAFAAGGTLRLKAGKRTVTLTGLRFKVGNALSIDAKLGAKRIVLLSVATTSSARLRRDAGAGTLAISGAPVSLTAAGAKAIRTALKLRRLPAGKLGTATVKVKVARAPVVTVPTTPTTPVVTTPTTPLDVPPDGPTSTTPTTTTTTPTTTTPTTTTTTPTTTTPTPPVDPFDADCPVGATSQTAPSGTQVVDPTLAGTAATGATFSWGFKQSFREYIVNMAGGWLLGRLGATYAANAFSFPFTGGTTTYPDDPVKAVMRHAGVALFCGLGHQFRIAIANPTVVIDGASSRLIGDVSENATGVLSGPNRVVVATLSLGGIVPVYDAVAKTVTWTGIPASLTAEASAAFGGFYAPGEQLDPVTAVVAVP